MEKSLINIKRYKQVFWIYFYKVMNKLIGMERCKKREPLKPMGIGKSVYPEGYIPPVKRTLSDGTVEFYIPIEVQKEFHKKLTQADTDMYNHRNKSIKKDENGKEL
jgi:hypothetical protein